MAVRAVPSVLVEGISRSDRFMRKIESCRDVVGRDRFVFDMNSFHWREKKKI